MQKESLQGFTLIEILIVVAIIAILASVVLVGLGPTQQQGRDARRISDLREVQTGLELYYNKEGDYPAATTWGPQSSAGTLSYLLANDGLGISQIPNDPNNNGSDSGATYYYCANSSQTAYVIGAQLETNSSAFKGYATPSTYGTGDGQCVPGSLTCQGSADKQYCLSL